MISNVYSWVLPVNPVFVENRVLLSEEVINHVSHNGYDGHDNRNHTLVVLSGIVYTI